MGFGSNDSRDTSLYLQGILKSRPGKNKGSKLPKPLKASDIINQSKK